MAVRVPFYVPTLPPQANTLVAESLLRTDWQGQGPFSRQMEAQLAEFLGAAVCRLTTSGTHALEAAALALGLGPDDEVVLPSYTVPATALAFALRGCRLRFVDSQPHDPTCSADALLQATTPSTRAMVVVHYGGRGPCMQTLQTHCRRQGIWLIEDAAQALGAHQHGRAFGSWGQLAAISFSKTKNLCTGKGGLLVVNDPLLADAAETVLDAGTNRKQFAEGQVAFYHWLGLGSNYRPPEYMAALLAAQWPFFEGWTRRRRSLWAAYAERLAPVVREMGWGMAQPEAAHERLNGHVFWLRLNSLQERNALANYLFERGIEALFHYQALHASPMGKCAPEDLPNATAFSQGLLRLPLYDGLTDAQLDDVCTAIEACVRSDYARQNFALRA